MPERTRHGQLDRSPEGRREDTALEPGGRPPEARDAEEGELVERLGDLVVEIGRRAAVEMGLDPPEVLLGPLFLKCREKLHKFDPSRSLEGWVWGYARRTAYELRRELRPRKKTEPLDENVESHRGLAAAVLGDDPSLLREESDEAVQRFLEQQRLSWERERDWHWSEAHLAAIQGYHQDAGRNLERVGLYDVLLGTDPSALVLPWRVMCCEIPVKELAGLRDTTPDAIYQALHRFRQAVRKQTSDRTRELYHLLGDGLN
jgi:hypothetical protein